MTSETEMPLASLTLEAVHRIAQNEMTQKSGALDHWALFGRLEELKRRPLSAQWLESMIMVLAIGRARPARTNGFLKKLRSRRVKDGDPQAFDTFDAALRGYLYPEKLTNHGYGVATFEDLDHETVWARVRAHLSELGDMGYEVFLDSGTLLGVVRDKRLIDHDDDVDLGIILKAETEAEAAREWISLRAALEERGLFDHASHRQAEIYKLTPVGDVQIDLFPTWISDGRVYVYPHTYGELEREDLLPLEPCAVSGLSMPAEAEKMLAINYGAGWQKPDPLFKFPWDKANARFQGFLKMLG